MNSKIVLSTAILLIADLLGRLGTQ